jgi:hypothetical protein
MMISDLEKSAALEALGRASARGVRAYNCGSCVRSLWYGEHAYTPEPMPPDAILRVELGRAIERLIIERLIAARPEMYAAAVEPEELPPLGRIRPDLLYLAADPPEPIEIKSMGAYPFRKFLSGEISEQYRAQGECYCRLSSAAPRWHLLAYCRDTSAMAERTIERDDALWNTILDGVATARGDNMPERPYGLVELCELCEGSGTTERGWKCRRCSGTGRDPHAPRLCSFPCASCGYRSECWGECEEITNGERTIYRPVAALTESLTQSIRRKEG